MKENGDFAGNDWGTPPGRLCRCLRPKQSKSREKIVESLGENDAAIEVLGRRLIRFSR